MKKAVSILLALFLLFNITGCEAMKKKFTRKKKAPVKMPRIYQVREYEKKPTPELYKKHYSYWESWHSELLKVLGRNHKKDMRCIEEITAHLSDMRNMLMPEKAAELEPRIDKLIRVKEIMAREDLTQFNKHTVIITLEREDRAIKRGFEFDKVKNYLKKSFDDES